MGLGCIQRISVIFVLSLAALAACKERRAEVKPAEELDVSLVGQALRAKNFEMNAPEVAVSEMDAGGGLLPETFTSGLVECQNQGRYFDLQIVSCTETPLASHSCDLTILLSEGSAVLNTDQKRMLKEYVESNLQGYSLYACTSDASQPILHFYKVDTDRIRAHNVRIESP